MMGLQSLPLTGALTGFFIGLGLLVVIFATRVWRRRNQNTGGWNRKAILRGFAVAAFIGSIGVMMTMVVGNSMRDRDGVLKPVNLSLITKPDGASVISLSPEDSVSEGDVIASFLTPSRVVEIDMVEVRRQKILSQIADIQAEPLSGVVAPEPDEQLAEQLLESRVLLNDLNAALSDLARRRLTLEDDQAGASRMATAAALVPSVAAVGLGGLLDALIVRPGSVSTQEQRLAEATFDAQDQAVQRAALAELSTREASLLAQRDALTVEIAIMEMRQNAEREARMAAAGLTNPAELERFEKLANLQREADNLATRIALARADTMVKAPHDGNIIFRSDAPLPGLGNPLILALTRAKVDAVALGSEYDFSGFMACLTLHPDEIDRLIKAGKPVTFKVNGSFETPFFEATYRFHESTDGAAAMPLVTFEAQPSPEVVETLLRNGQPLRVTLMTVPHPFYGSPLWLSLGLMLAAVLLFVWQMPARRVLGPSEAKARAVITDPAGAAVPQRVALSSEDPTAIPGSHGLPNGPMPLKLTDRHQQKLATMAHHFKVHVERGTLEPKLLASLEWMIDRYPQQAVEALTTVLSEPLVGLRDALELGELDPVVVRRARTILTLVRNASPVETNALGFGPSDDGREQPTRLKPNFPKAPQRHPKAL